MVDNIFWCEAVCIAPHLGEARAPGSRFAPHVYDGRCCACAQYVHQALSSHRNVRSVQHTSHTMHSHMHTSHTYMNTHGLVISMCVLTITITRVLAENLVWVGFLVVCYLSKINPNPRKKYLL